MFPLFLLYKYAEIKMDLRQHEHRHVVSGIEMGKGKSEWGVKSDRRKNFRMQTSRCFKYKYVSIATTEMKTDSNKEHIICILPGTIEQHLSEMSKFQISLKCSGHRERVLFTGMYHATQNPPQEEVIPAEGQS